MSATDEWTNVLRDHPIFALPKSLNGLLQSSLDVLELSTTTLPKFNRINPEQDEMTPSGRRQVMILKDADLILAAGREIRISSVGDLKLTQTVRKSYKTLYTPTLQFEIHQIALNPTGKLLAVAGAFQVAVIVLPRPGYSRLVSEFIDCKSVQVGQFYHAAPNSAPVAKIEWHPWGEAGSTLLVMTTDGKLREYDISLDTEEPQQILSFVPERKSGSFMAEDESEREVASFTLGKGRADWGPLTVYAVMRSGDIYSICPYLPANASVPSSYIHSLECFISAKQEFLSQDSSSTKILSTMYDYQRKYVTALVKQLPAGTVFPSTSRSVTIHPPTTIKAPPQRQGPFLLQPSPRVLEGSEGGDATDITYLSFGTEDNDSEENVRDTEHLGVVLVSFQDGKVDLFLDVEKVEARWDTKQTSRSEFPMLAVYESIDLSLVSAMTQVSTPPGSKPLLDLLVANYPVFLIDPLHDDMVYVYHAFGAHALDISPVLKGLASALKEDDDDDAKLKKKLGDPVMTNVRPILNTFSVQKGTSNPVIALTIPNDVYITYSIFILTSTMRITTIPLNIRSEPPEAKNSIAIRPSRSAQIDKGRWLTPAHVGLPIYVSLLGTEPFTPPTLLSNPSGLPSNPKLSLPAPLSGSKEFTLTPDTLRFIGKTVAQISTQTGEIVLAYNAAMSRLTLQKSELSRLLAKCKDMEFLVERLRGPAKNATGQRVAKIQEEQKRLLGRYDRLLQALMAKASPELSEYETKWFGELKRMKQEILGSGKYDEDSLVMRIQTLEKEYARISPLLKALAAKEQEKGKKHPEESQSLGVSQAFEYGELSNISRLRISALENKITKLAGRLDVSIEKPPSNL